MTLQWFPAYCVITGNEKVETHQDFELNVSSLTTTYTVKEKTTLIKNLVKRRPSNKDHHPMDKQKLVTISRPQNPLIINHILKRSRPITTSGKCMCVCVCDQYLQV